MGSGTTLASPQEFLGWPVDFTRARSTYQCRASDFRSLAFNRKERRGMLRNFFGISAVTF